MVLEHAFMKLVKEVGGEASEYVAMGKISPEGLIDGTYTILFELRRISPLLML
jgi:hypothetical protein